MQVEVRAVKFSADVKLITFIKDRLKKLEQFHEHRDL